MVKDIQVKDIMIKDVAAVSPTSKVTTAALIMSKKNIGSILVLDEKDLLGILTEKDLLHKVVAVGKDPKNLLVKDIMTSSLITIKPSTPVFDAHKIMHDHKFRRLPVVDNNKLLGIVTETDLSKSMRNYGTSINPSFEKPKMKSIKSVNKYKLEDGKSYVVVEEKQDKIYDAFVSKIAEGYAGLGVIRTSAEIFKNKYGLKKTLMIWLTELSGENVMKPTELEKLIFTITSFINNAEKSVILIDGLEFMENYTSFKEVFHLLQTLVDRVSVSKSIMLVSMDKDTFDNKEFHLLERGLKILSS